MGDDDATAKRSDACFLCAVPKDNGPLSEEAETATSTQSHPSDVELLEEATRVFLQQLSAFSPAQARSHVPRQDPDPALASDRDTAEEDKASIEPSDQLGVRMWTDRLSLYDHNSGAAPLLGTTGTETSVPVQPVELDGDSTRFGVVVFRNGVYRGQVDAVDQTELTAAGGSEPSARDSYNNEDNLPSQQYQAELLVPHGYGVWTSADGSTRCGQWTRGEQIGVGSQQLRGVMAYEGEWVGDVPAGGGVATFANGQSFAGQWAGGRPYGLGALRTPSDASSIDASDDVCGPCSGDAIGTDTATATEGGEPRRSVASIDATVDRVATRLGWFYGTQCLQSCGARSPDEDDAANDGQVGHDVSVLSKEIRKAKYPRARLAIPPKFEHQPLRGLFIAGMRLEQWRVAKLRCVLGRWRLLCCAQAVEHARQSRLQALLVWQVAHAAQHRAIREHITRSVEQRKRDDHELLQLAHQCRTRRMRAHQVQAFHEQRHAVVASEYELAQRCERSQEDAVGVMQSELRAIEQLLKDARQAQADCSRHSRRLQALKRQIENVSIKLNGARVRKATEAARRQLPCQQRRLSEASVERTDSSGGADAYHSVGAAAEPRPNTTMLPATATTTIDAKRHHSAFVCDVAGCECGIPRDVFVRIGAALNGEL